MLKGFSNKNFNDCYACGTYIVIKCSLKKQIENSNPLKMS